MEKPTLEQYEQAIEHSAAISDWISTSRMKQTELIDKLAEERDREKWYLTALEYNRKIIMQYELYEALEERRPS